MFCVRFFSWAGRYVGQSVFLNSKMFRLAGIWKLPQHGQASYGSLEAHMEELPHPSRNLTVSRVVIMVRMYTRMIVLCSIF